MPVCLSNLSGSGLLFVLPSLMDPTRIPDFSVCLALYLLLGRSGDFQASYMWKWKLVHTNLNKTFI